MCTTPTQIISRQAGGLTWPVHPSPKGVGHNIFLTGMMGCGKTTVGAALAKRLGRRFLDTDHEIEARTGVPPAVIFEFEQEAGFRQREARVIDELTQYQGIVLATGGGAILRQENRTWLRARGTVVYLHAPPQLLWPRLQNDKNRPLLQTDHPLCTLESLYSERDALYRACAHYVVDAFENTHLSINGLVKKVLTHLA